MKLRAAMAIAMLAMTGLASAQTGPAQTPMARQGQPGWARTAEGCHVWNPAPLSADEAVSWSGACRNGRAEGIGVQQWGTPGAGSRYEGSFQDGRRQGKGRMTYPAGHTYDGDWDRDLRHGQGVFTFYRQGSVSTIYDGAFVGGQAHGQGVVTNKAAGRVDRVTAEKGCILIGHAWMVIGANRGDCRH